MFTSLLLFRARLPIETQEIEGWNSIVQKMTKVAPNVKVALVSDRLKNKCGDYMTPSECTDIHGAIVEFMGSRA